MDTVQDEDDVDLKKLRYAIYVRRSSEESAKNKQVRSLPDQIKHCKDFAKRNKLHVIGKPLEEKWSAKIAGKRDVFNTLLEDIEAGKYDAILSYAPDRLSRNMLEGGLLINMLDEGKLKDLRFVTHHFTNDASGKLTLGIMFSISKHFSDDLSGKVKRGIKGNFSEGKSSGSPKHGYDRDEITGLYKPNKFFNIVQEAWLMRANGDTYEVVNNYLLNMGYHRTTKDKKTKRIIKPSVNAVAKMFADPFYFGKLVQAKQDVFLPDIYDFEPMVGEEMFNAIQVLGYGRRKDVTDKKRAAFYPLRGFVYCGVCDDTTYMVVGKNKSRDGTHKLTYRCDNPTCTREVKSFRAKHVFNSITTMLEGLELTDEAYERYSKQIDGQTGSRIVAIKEQVQSKRGALTHIKKELKDRSLAITSYEATSPIYIENEARINELAQEQADLETEITNLCEKIVDPDQIKVSKQEFLNTLKSAPDKMKAGTAIEKDRVCRILFLNLRVDNEKVTSYLWREPFRSLVTFIENNSGVPL